MSTIKATAGTSTIKATAGTSAQVIPFPTGLRHQEIAARLASASPALIGLSSNPLRRAFIAGYLDCLMENAVQKTAPPPARRRR